MKERENRRLDYDRSRQIVLRSKITKNLTTPFRAEVKSLTVNPNADPQKLQKAQRQLAINKHVRTHQTIHYVTFPLHALL